MLSINYKWVEESAPSYSIRGKLETGIFDVKEDYDDPTKLLGFESNNISAINQKLPDFNVVKESLPRFIMPKAERFSNTANNFNPIHSYQSEYNSVPYNNNKKFKL